MYYTTMYYTSPIRCITQQLFSPGRERGVCSLKVRTLKRKKTQRLKMISGCRSYKTRYRKHSKRILIQAMLVSRSSLLSALLVLASRMPRTPVVDWSIGRLVDWSIGRLVDWSTGRLVDWSIGRLSNSMESTFCVDCLQEALRKYGTRDERNSWQSYSY